MNFYTSISKSTMDRKKWLFLMLTLTFVTSLLIFTINYIVDPYNITKYNLLNIKYKFARDDRTEKVNFFTTLNRFDNIVLGSSRVYTVNPKKISEKLGGTTYNFGVGTATVEDHLGVLLYLKRENKLPKNLIIGVDFYTFSPDIPPNKYFLENQNLNFLSYENHEDEYFSKFFSLDSLRASIKTLKKHLNGKNQKSRFDQHGWAGVYEDYSKRDVQKDFAKVKEEIQKDVDIFYSNLTYKQIDKKKVQYYERIRKMCEENNITLYLFSTPLHPELLNILKNNANTQKALNEFLSYMNSFENFYNFYEDNDMYSDLRNFYGSTHTSTNAGDIIIEKLFTKAN